jgi:hypothetical protein
MDARRYVFLCLVALSFDMLAACTPKDVGYVEIKTVPVATPTTTLYLDSLKFEPPKNGSAVLRQQVGTAKLSAQASGGQMAVLCDIVVRKNRITTVTISLLERPPRCQCRNIAVSEPSAVRSCIG